MREFELKSKGTVAPCPKCGNTTRFKAFSYQYCEDGCEVWVECGNCGFNPTKSSMDRYESVWGGTGDSNVMAALDCWTDAIKGGDAL